MHVNQMSTIVINYYLIFDAAAIRTCDKPIKCTIQV